jgi:hypothetical protein
MATTDPDLVLCALAAGLIVEEFRNMGTFAPSTPELADRLEQALQVTGVRLGCNCITVAH